MRCQLAPLLRRKLLVLLPFLTHFLALFRRKLLERLVLFPGDAPLRGRQARPGAHLLLDALLLLGRHARITVRDAKPLLFALGVELVPFGGQWRENLPIGSWKLGPGWGAEHKRGRSGGQG